MSICSFRSVRMITKFHGINESTPQGRSLTTDHRNRMSKLWIPTGGITPEDEEQDESHSLLIRAGYLRQAHSGVFHLLPVGLRVQNKLEALIDKHMQSLSASKVSLSSITTEALWKKSGRYSAKAELLRIHDRRDSKFLLSPTHEEEITSLVASLTHSYKDLPIRLYQIGRKYRDEKRPRQGLLRAKEFVMKDLYTFDDTPEKALVTYEAVRKAYDGIFAEMKIPFLVADADSGNMGGDISHEYHFVSSKGEDHVWYCNSCTYVANEELVEKKSPDATSEDRDAITFTGISTDRTTMIKIVIPRSDSSEQVEQGNWSDVSSFVNVHAVARALPENVKLLTGLESATLATLLPHTTKTIQLCDRSISKSNSLEPKFDLTVTRKGDPCPRCPQGKLDVHKAIEVGHTFHLGTRYSKPLDCFVSTPTKNPGAPMQMGCHGIGVSRIIGAVASLLCDNVGLNWPRVIAPYEVVVLMNVKGSNEDAVEIYDLLSDCGSSIDVVLDDRPYKSLGWKIKDAELIGSLVMVIVGRAWKESRAVELRCRRLGINKEVQLDKLKEEIAGLLHQL